MKDPKVLGATLIAVVIIVVGFALLYSEREEAPFRIGIDSRIEGLAPWNARGPLTIRVLSQVYEPLIGVDRDGHLSAQLAAAWDTQDGKTWTITLRNDRPIHGFSEKQLTANDVKAALERLMRPDSYNAFVLSGIIEGSAAFSSNEAEDVSGITVVDDDTLRIVLNEPQQSFPYRLAFPGLLIHKPVAEDDADLPAGTGPFQVDSLGDTGRIVMRRFAAYPGYDENNENLVDLLSFEPVGDPAFRAQSVVRGELDLAIVDKQAVDSLLDRDSVTIEQWLPFNIHFVGFNAERLPEIDLRRAISIALDREVIRDRILDGGATISIGFIPPNMADGEPPELPSLDDQALNDLVNQSGYDGRTLQLIVHQQANSENIGTYVKSRLNEIGISVEVETLDFQTVLTRMVEGSSDMFSMFFDYSYVHPGLVLDAFIPSNIPVPNFWRFQPVDDELLQEMMSLRRSALNDASLRRLEKEIVASAPAAFLFAETKYVVMTPTASNIWLSPVNQLNLINLQRQ